MQNKQWQSLFTRYGFQMTSTEKGFLVFRMNEENHQFLRNVLEQLDVDFYMNEKELIIDSAPVTEEKFVEELKKLTNGRTEMLYYVKDLPLSKVDIYIKGIVTQLNRLECLTAMSCDGHGKRAARIGFQNAKFRNQAQVLFDFIQLPYRSNEQGIFIRNSRELLPQFAETLSLITLEEAKQMYKESTSVLSKEVFNEQLETLLNIPGASGDEGQIRKHVMNEITPYVDNLTTDTAGNVLAIKRFGNGPTILLNAHLDTVEEISPAREILKENNIWKSSEGILGADDRAGINVILAIAKSLTEKDFNGTIKYIFTVEEEIGLVGAYEVNEAFLWDINMAFVIDRRGNGDIVTSNYLGQQFCNQRFGNVTERIAKEAGMPHWKVTTGGSSDTVVWANNEIQSINLSAGYKSEHTENEQLDVEANYGTYELVLELLASSRRLAHAAKWVRIERNMVGS